jgi:hypothetical protein
MVQRLDAPRKECGKATTPYGAREESSFFSFFLERFAPCRGLPGGGLLWIMSEPETGKTLCDAREEFLENVRVDSLYLPVVCCKKRASILAGLRKFRIYLCRHR